MRFRHFLLLALIALLAIGAWQHSALQRMWRRSTGPVPAPLLVVLPFDATGAPAADSFLSEGLAQDLAARLGQTAGLQVFGRSGASRLVETPLDALTENVGASAVVKGSVTRSGNSVSVSVNLIAARDQASFWSERFAGEAKDLLALQSKAARAIAGALKVRDQATSSETRAFGRSVDPGAVNAYLQGLDAFAARKPAEAVSFFEKAVAADGELAEAHAAIAIALQAINTEEGIPDDPARTTRMKAAGARAYQLDPESAAANLAAGLASDSFDASIARMKYAVDLDPSNALALEALGDAVRDADPDRALAFYGRALTADPFLETAHLGNATTMIEMQRWGQGKAELLRVRWEYAPTWGLAMFPVYGMSEGSYGDALADLMTKTPQLRERPYFLAQLVESLAYLPKTYVADPLTEGQAAVKKFPGDCDVQAALAGVLADRGKLAEAREVAQPWMAAAEGADARESTIRCAMTAAAALGDGTHVAALLDRLLASEELFRNWSFARYGQSGRLLLMGKIYPWTKVVTMPPVADARGRIDAALDEQNQTIRTLLGPIAYK